MKLARQRLEALALAIAAGALTVVLHYFGEFTIRESILLGLCFTIVALWVYQSFKLSTFEPYSVEIFVNFDAIRDDLGMSVSEDPAATDEPVHELYRFTAINAAVFVENRRYKYKTAFDLDNAGKAARSDDRYRSVISFSGEIPGVLTSVCEWGNPKTNIFLLPKFDFRPGWDGYQLQIKVVPEWWSEYRKQSSSQVRDLTVSYDGWITLAVLPYGYIPDHIRRLEKPLSLFYPFEMMHRRWKSKLASQGWTVSETYPSQIDRKYLNISSDGI